VVLLQPAPHLVPEGGLRLGEAQVHGRSLSNWPTGQSARQW
jgi:hypothetical protein